MMIFVANFVCFAVVCLFAFYNGYFEVFLFEIGVFEGGKRCM